MHHETLVQCRPTRHRSRTELRVEIQCCCYVLLQSRIRIDNMHKLSSTVYDESHMSRWDWEVTEDDTVTLVGRQCVKSEDGKVTEFLLFTE